MEQAKDETLRKICKKYLRSGDYLLFDDVNQRPANIVDIANYLDWSFDDAEKYIERLISEYKISVITNTMGRFSETWYCINPNVVRYYWFRPNITLRRLFR